MSIREIKLRSFRSSAYGVLVALIIATSVGAQDRKVSFDELTARHLQSIGKASGAMTGPAAAGESSIQRDHRP
jgi:hypothetical protein